MIMMMMMMHNTSHRVCHVTPNHSEMTPNGPPRITPRIPPFERVARNTPCLHGRGLGGRVCTDPLCGWLASGISGCVTCHRMVVMMIMMMMMDAQHIASCVSCHSEYIDVCTHPDAPLDTPPGQWLCGGAGTGLLHPSG